MSPYKVITVWSKDGWKLIKREAVKRRVQAMGKMRTKMEFLRMNPLRAG